MLEGHHQAVVEKGEEMKALWNKTAANMVYWKIAYLKAGLLAFISFQAALQAGTANISWVNLGTFERWMVILSALAAACTALSGFLDRTMSRLDAGKPPVETGNTQVFNKQPENG